MICGKIFTKYLLLAVLKWASKWMSDSLMFCQFIIKVCLSTDHENIIIDFHSTVTLSILKYNVVKEKTVADVWFYSWHRYAKRGQFLLEKGFI